MPIQSSSLSRLGPSRTLYLFLFPLSPLSSLLSASSPLSALSLSLAPSLSTTQRWWLGGGGPATEREAAAVGREAAAMPSPPLHPAGGAVEVVRRLGFCSGTLPSARSGRKGGGGAAIPSAPSSGRGCGGGPTTLAASSPLPDLAGGDAVAPSNWRGGGERGVSPLLLYIGRRWLPSAALFIRRWRRRWRRFLMCSFLMSS